MKLFATCTILALTTSIGWSDEAALVTVWLNDGRRLTAEVDRRCDNHRLWLRFSEPSITLTSSFAWDKVIRGAHDGQSYNAEQFRRLALKLRPNGLEVQLPTPNGETSATPGPRRAPSADYRPPPRVRSVEIGAALANWDSDAEFDGFDVYLYPLSKEGRVIPVHGTLRLELIGQRYVRGQVPKDFVELARASHIVKTRDFRPNNATIYRLPFQSNDSEVALDFGTLGMVFARLSIPGQGTFESSVTARVRSFDPLRDQLRLRGESRLPRDLRREMTNQISRFGHDE